VAASATAIVEWQKIYSRTCAIQHVTMIIHLIFSDSSSISESHTESRSWQQEVQELLKNPGLRRDMRLAAQQNLDDRLQSLGIKVVSVKLHEKNAYLWQCSWEPIALYNLNVSGVVQGVSGLSKGVYKSTMVQIITDRQKRQEEDPAYRRVQKEINHKLEQRVKERNTEQPAKPKQHEQGQDLALQFQGWEQRH